MTLNLILQPTEPTLAQLDTPQICYVLVTLRPQTGSSGDRPVNWALVADASRSMRIPIVDEAQFRQLVRAGGAHEVLVDGIPVWQLTEPVDPQLRGETPSALDYTARALHSVVEQMDAADRFTLVACAEHARVLVPNTSGADRAVLVRGIEQLKLIDLGEATDLARGLHLALNELVRGRAASDTKTERILLLTDGFTQYPDTCLKLAQQAAAEGVTISTLGLGGDFQDDLLTALADAGGGRAMFMRHAATIPQAVRQELAAARAVTLRTVTLTLRLSRDVTLRRATRIQPALSQLTPTMDDPRTVRLYPGDLESGTPVTILLELLAPATPPLHPAISAVDDGTARRMRLARLILNSPDLPTTTHDLVATYTRTPTAPPPTVLEAVAYAHAARLQRQAMEAAAQGDHAAAATRLRAAADRLTDLGENDLAAAALHEALSLEQTGQTSGVGAKELTYATRRLRSEEA